MTSIQRKLFWNEIDSIQERHSLFFPEEQKKYISISENDSGPQLIFPEGYDLPSVITMEIELAFRLIAGSRSSIHKS